MKAEFVPKAPRSTKPAEHPPIPSLLACLDHAGNLRADAPGWPGAAWAHEARGPRWIEELIHGDDAARVRAWVAAVFVNPIRCRIWIAGAFVAVLLGKSPRHDGWVIVSEPAA